MTRGRHILEKGFQYKNRIVKLMIFVMERRAKKCINPTVKDREYQVRQIT